MGEKQMHPKHQTLALSPCLGRMEMLRFIWNCLRPFGFIVVEGDPRPMTNGRCRKRTKKQKPETGNSKLDTYERMRNRREDFRLQTSDVSWTARALHAATARAARR